MDTFRLGASSVSHVSSEPWGHTVGKCLVFILLESAFKSPVSTFQYLYLKTQRDWIAFLSHFIC